MRIEGKVTKEIDVLQDMICDICGKSCKVGSNYISLDLFVCWGYGSNHDGENWEAEVCETCVVEKLAPLIKFRKEERSIY